MRVCSVWLVCFAVTSGCATQMTVTDFVNSRVPGDDQGLKATIEAANTAQSAFHMRADTPIKEIRLHPEALADMVSHSRDAYRHARSYGPVIQSSRLDTTGVKLTDVRQPVTLTIPIRGMNAVFRIAASPDGVTVLEIDTSRGLPIITFDSGMTPTIAPRFIAFLQGDHIDVSSDVLLQLDRSGGTEMPSEMPYSQ